MKNSLSLRIYGSMKSFILILISFISVQSQAAILNFFSNPRVPQPIFHVTLEYKGIVYEADTHDGGRGLPLTAQTPKGDIRVEISDDLINEQELASQMGLPFDYNFVWDNQKTYCSKLVGKALNIQPTPMDFSGTHYVKYYPNWINRHDPGLSPDQIYFFAMDHALRVSRKAGSRAPERTAPVVPN